MNLNVGFGLYNITPPLGVRLAGYRQREGVAEDVHDELTARAVTFELAGESAAIVVADICSLPEELGERTRVRLSERTGIPEDHVIVVSNHTHSGPALYDESTYRELLPDLMASAGELAWKQRRPARISFGTGRAAGLCINRRDLRGPVDEEFSYVEARDSDGSPFGVLFAYALHGVVMGHVNLSISADYFGAARRVVEAGLPGAQTVFVAPPSGDINPLTPSVKKLIKEHGDSWYTDDPLTGIYDRSTGTFEEVEKLGGSLGKAVLKALSGAGPLEPQKLSARTWTVDLGSEEEVPMSLSAIEMDDLVILALQGEHFVETGSALKRMADEAGKRVILLSHMGQICYVPTPDAFEHGGYEVESARRKGLAEDAQQRILESVRGELFPA